MPAMIYFFVDKMYICREEIKYVQNLYKRI